MGKLLPNGSPSGTVGKYVFVQATGRTLLRSLPGKVRQTKNTQRAASQFGWLSRRELFLRHALLGSLPLTVDSSVAYRHRSVLSRMLVRQPSAPGKLASLMEGDPQWLWGFDFNQNAPWTDRCRDFFTVSPREDNRLLVGLPALAAGANLPLPPHAKQVRLGLAALAADLDADGDIPLTLFSIYETTLTATQQQPAKDWLTDAAPAGRMLLLIGNLQYTLDVHGAAGALSYNSATYLWAGKQTNLHKQ